MEKGKLAISFLILAFLVTDAYAGSTSDKAPPEKCVSCHSDSLAFKEWEVSSHANALKTLLKDPNAARSCLKCHSADYNRFRFNPWTALSDLPHPKEAGNSISCSACHRHQSELESSLIMPVDKLCANCHVLYCGG